MTPRHTDQRFLRERQYRDSSHLKSRITLHQRFGTNPYGWQRWALDQIDPRPGMALLEVGCGPGTLWLDNLARLPALSLTLVDLSRGMVTEATTALHSTLAPRGLVADAQQLPFADGSFDTVVANFVMHHVPDGARAAAQFRRVLRPGGRLIAATFGDGHMRELRELALAIDPDLPFARWEPPTAFRLENGAVVLQTAFSFVERHDFADGLLVDDAAALAEYILSSTSDSATTDDPRYDGLVAALVAALDGAPLSISKTTGLFVAR